MNLNSIKKNMTEINTGTMSVLFSYKTPVACYDFSNGSGTAHYYRTSTRWSNTTQRHINQWLNGNVAEEKPQEFFDGLVK